MPDCRDVSTDRASNSGVYLPAAFFAFCARNFAHLALVAAAILFLPAADMARFAGAGAVVFAAPPADPFPALAHRALCACAIFLREATDTIRVGRVDSRDTPVPFKDSITEIA
jgi:hypothetical protein